MRRAPLQRKTPMKRGGWSRAPAAQDDIEDRPMLPAPTRPAFVPRARMATFTDPVAPIQKDNPVRHEGYRRLVAALPCINCGKRGRSQHAHENSGKGKSMKVDDRRAVPLCADEPGLVGCHSRYDQYRLLDGGRQAHADRGRIWSAQTRAAIMASGQWPAGLPVWPGDTTP